MSIYDNHDIATLIRPNPYVGRGIIVGKTADGTHAAVAYFIMGRSENSRNRIFCEEGDALMIHPYDLSRVEDPSLIIYAPVREYGPYLVVTNGDQTDTVYVGLKKGVDFAESLRTRTFEPDAPNFTPRISALLQFADGDFNYRMNILKSADAEGSAPCRFTFDYPALPGVGHFLHTYITDGNPLPTFTGEPERVIIPDDIDTMTDTLWNALNEENRISLYVRYVRLSDGFVTRRIINRHGDAQKAL